MIKRNSTAKKIISLINLVESENGELRSSGDMALGDVTVVGSTREHIPSSDWNDLLGIADYFTVNI